MDFVLNHITAPLLSYRELFAMARRLGCVGVELRNDLPRPLFDGDAPREVAAAAKQHGLRIVGLSQVYPFNAWSDEVRDKVKSLIGTAQACGAETISLIPRNDGVAIEAPARVENLERAIAAIAPMLDGTGLVALIEPLGFERSSLRSKAETVQAIKGFGAAAPFKIVHDTFHHYLAGGGDIFPEVTGIVHISGVVDPTLSPHQMADEDRVLIDASDRLGNCTQLAALQKAGYRGPISFEAFSPETHHRPDLEAALAQSMAFIRAQVQD